MNVALAVAISMMAVNQGSRLPTAFNLDCDVQSIRHYEPDIPYTTEDRLTYRVDLEARRWCRDQCRETRPIYEITDGQLVLEQTDRGNISRLVMVNRETGRLIDYIAYEGRRVEARGTCQRSEFTGFPERRF